MKYILLLFLLTISNNILSQDFTETQKENQKKYTSFLIDEGFRSEITNAGNIKFKYEGNTFFIMTDYINQNYFEIQRSLSFKNGCSEALYKAVNESNLYKTNTALLIFGDNKCDNLTFKNGNNLNDPNDFKSIFFNVITQINNRIEVTRDEFSKYNLFE